MVILTVVEVPFWSPNSNIHRASITTVDCFPIRQLKNTEIEELRREIELVFAKNL